MRACDSLEKGVIQGELHIHPKFCLRSFPNLPYGGEESKQKDQSYWAEEAEVGVGAFRVVGT